MKSVQNCNEGNRVIEKAKSLTVYLQSQLKKNKKKMKKKMMMNKAMY